ncbi:MAG: hypothetical protein U5R48_14740 [Gammaproteobacteria bacterium]|nr:hypothetical protein [Gammaproteobacteria bacterium]
MKVDGNLGTDLKTAPERVAALEAEGLRRGPDRGDEPRSLLPAAAGGGALESGGADHLDRGGLRPQPDDPGGAGA